MGDKNLQTAVTAGNFYVDTASQAPANSSVILVFPDTGSTLAPNAMATQLGDGFRSYIYNAAPPQADVVLTTSAKLLMQLETAAVKRATALGIGDGCALAQALAFQSPKLIRRLVLLNPTARLHPRLLDRLVDRIERVLPLGLPLRPLSRDFDSRSFLHRISCPTLILYTPSSGDFISQQSQFIAEKIPNAWIQPLENSIFDSWGKIHREILDKLEAFLQVPAKRPQKNVKAVSNG